MTSLLLVEDDKNLSDSLSQYLRSEQYEIRLATSVRDAKNHFESRRPDLIILDWMLPDGQGPDLIRDLKAKGNCPPIILLTARSELIDKVLGLECGADDYITKPFETRELVARIRARLRSGMTSSSPAQEEIGFAGITVNTCSREAYFQGTPLDLTKIEFDLLALLVTNPMRVFPREALLNQVWGYENFPTTRTVDNHIVQLRQKTHPEIFETVRGVGYRIRELKK